MPQFTQLRKLIVPLFGEFSHYLKAPDKADLIQYSWRVDTYPHTCPGVDFIKVGRTAQI